MQHLIFSILFLFLLSSTNAQQSEDYNWANVPIGGGGYISGMQIHPLNSNVKYFRTDVGGAYKWDSLNNRLKQIIYSTESEHYSVAGIALHPTNLNVVYFAVGRRCSNSKSAIYKSIDAGETFEVVTNLPFYFAANGGRDCDGNNNDKDREGTPIAVNPLNTNELYIGTRGDGLWKMNVVNNAFTQITQVPTNTNQNIISTIKFHPTAQNILFLTYVNDGVYRGNTLNNQYAKLTFSATIDAALLKAIDLSISKNADYMLVACKTSGILKATNILGATSWQITSTVNQNEGEGYLTVECSPHNNNEAIICAAKWNFLTHIETSINSGNTWNETDHSFDFNNNIFPWKTTGFGSNIGQFAFDPSSENIIHFSSFMSTFTCDNFNATTGGSWNTLNAKAHEEIVATDLVAIPVNSANNFLVCGSADHAGFLFDDITEDNYATGEIRDYLTVPNPLNLKKSNSIDFCYNQPDNIIVSLTYEWNNTNGGIVKTTDGGLTWNFVTDYDTLDEKSIIAMSSNNPENIVFLNKNGLKYSLDGGNTIFNSTGTNANINSINTSVFSSFRNIAADKVLSDVFYYYDWNGDFFKSTNAGVNWVLQNGNTLPASNDAWQKARLTAIPNQANHLWFNINQQLFRSTDGGLNWIEYNTIDKVIALGTGVGENAGDYDAIYIYGKINGDNQNYFYRSTDEAQTWARINNHAEKELWNDTKLIAGDRNTFGKVYVSASGQGVIFGEIVEDDICENEEKTIDGTFDELNSPNVPNWNLHVEGNAIANGSINQWDNAIIDISNGGSFDWDVQLWQDDLEIEENKFYLLTTKLQSDEQDRTVTIKLRNKVDGSIVYIEETIELTSVKQDYSILFEAKSTDNDVRLTFLFGADNNNLNIDKISLLQFCEQPIFDESYCNDYVYLKDHNINPTYFKAATQLKSDGKVNENGFTSFKAGSEVLLINGFEVSQGVEFQAIIDSCE